MKNLIKWFTKQSKIDKVITVITVICVTYFVICWLDVITHNQLPGQYTYSWWNMFDVLFK